MLEGEELKLETSRETVFMDLAITNTPNFTTSRLLFSRPCNRRCTRSLHSNYLCRHHRSGVLACKNQQHQEISHQTSSMSTQEARRNLENEAVLMVIDEKVGSTLLRKYKVDKKQSLSVEEVDMDTVTQVSKTPGIEGLGRVSSLDSIPHVLKDFFLPTDFPDSVSHDYLPYMIWQFPTNITGWVCSSLVTSSLLKAVGLEAWAGTTVAATAAIKWISKDGLGAFGRLFIGGQFGRVFDDDPKQWRMYAELIGSFGSLFELATPVKPDWFLPLAALGRLTKAIGRGLKDPSFRVIQNHFAISRNMGEVSAKEEVWEVSAELIGIALGVVLLASPDLASSYSSLVLTWASIRSLHLWLRYQSLASLQFSTINFKRAFIMTGMHVTGSSIPGVLECNVMENILLPWQLWKPYLRLGCSLRDAFDGEVLVSELEEILGLFSDERHVLILKSSVLHKVDMHVIFKEGATSLTVLRCLWQGEWIMNALSLSTPRPASSWTLGSQQALLAKSLDELDRSFDEFVLELGTAGWDTSRLVLKIPKGSPFLVVSNSQPTVDS